MSLREKLNKNPAVIAAIAIVAIAGCGWIIWSQFWPHHTTHTSDSAFYTVDDGQTLFPDASGKLAPFDKDGKSAVKAYVYRCPDGTQKVAYLERFTEKGKAVTEKYRAEQKANPGQPPASVGDLVALGRSAREVKRPADKEWISAATGADRRFIEELTCKSGEAPVLIEP